MISEAQSGLGAMGVPLIVAAALCVYGFYWFIRRNNVLLAFSLAVVGAAVLAAPVILQIKSARANRPFDVIVVNDRVSETGFLRRQEFKGGRYTGPDGRNVVLQRRDDWPRTATLIVNDSERLVTIRRFQYTARRIGLSFGTPLIQVVFPGEHAVAPGYVHSMQDEGTSPPKTIRSDAPFGTVDILFRSLKKYDSARHGTRAGLLAERDRLR